jgi:DNA polymerase III subunit gamma/tau
MAENFIVSARKYRPDNWDTVVGQKSITSTLQNAIANQQIAQAYLFTGPRGVGKTTCARIFAKAVNGHLGIDTQDLQFNIFELDAASNNSVDDIRTIVDSVRIPPQNGKYKVYIIDEVHMLSQAAFNAFLKTLEEPPAHAIFILATTEKHKILPTILSRCQIFDFNRIKVKDIAEHLADIATKEGISAEPDALHVIAQKADGAMRDALSIFDQVVAFCGRNLTYHAVIENLNVLDYDYYFKLTDYIIAEDIPSSLVLFDDVLNKGFDGHHFISGLGAHFRNLLVCKDAKTISLLEVSESVAEKYKSQAAAAPIQQMIRGLEFINECDIQYRGSKHQRLLVELALMQLCSIPYNEKEGEKKKRRLKPFRAGQQAASNAGSPARVATPSSNRPSVPTGSNGSANGGAQVEVAAPSVPKPARPVTMAGAASLFSSAGSLKTILNDQRNADQSVKEEAALTIEKPTRSYSQEEITKAWTEFAQTKLGNNKQVQSAFVVARLELLDNETLRVAFPSETQTMYFNDYRGMLGDFLRNEYDIRGVNFEVSIQRSNEKVMTIRSDKEKFEAMKAKNPALDSLWRKFQLRVD